MIRLLILVSALGFSQAVVDQVCDGASSSCGGISTIRGAGFQTSLPWDATNEGFLYFSIHSSMTSIYSGAIFFYDALAQTFSLKIYNGATLNSHCGQNGTPYDTYEPLLGHPEGSVWTDGTYLHMTNQLCSAQYMGFTNRYQLSSETMASRLSVAPHATGDGTFNASAVSFQRMVYAPNVSKAFWCCYSGGGSTPKVIEFNGATYTNVTGSLTGGTIPGPLTGHGMVYLDGLIYVFGGCNGTSPGNVGASQCASPLNGIFSLNPSTYAVTLLSPSGTPPATPYTSFPLIAADSTRNRILVVGHNGTAAALFAYSVSGNSWSELTTTGDALPVLPVNDLGSGNMAGYDPVHDKMVTIVSRSQSFVPEVHNMSFAATGQFRILSTWPSGDAKWIQLTGLATSVSAGSTTTVTLTGPGGLSVPVTVQEALYAGGSTGVTRTDEPFVVGIPIADSANITSTAGLALTGTTAVAASDMATDGSTIVVSTNGGTCGAGTAICFDVKKANFNVLNRVRIGSTEILASSTAETRGLVLTGPSAGGSYPANVTCSPESGGATCNVVYSSANDSSSTVTIEQNGPLMTVLRADGTHKDSSGNPYMKFTARMYFYAGKSYVKVTSILRNADYGTSGTFATAYKGFDGYELRLDANISGTLSWTIANETATPASGTMSGSNTTYIYQGETDFMKFEDWCGFQCVSYSPDNGWNLNVNGSDTDTGAQSESVGGWANIEDSSGVGLSIGVYQMSAYWPKSLEFLAGGPDVRVGIWSSRNSINHYQAWPQHSTHDVFLNFHASTLSAANARDAFLKFQHYLVGRATPGYYNDSGVLSYPMVTATEENNYYNAIASTASPPISSPATIADRSPTDAAMPLDIYRWYGRNAGGGANQSELRWSDWTQFIRRGYTGRYLNSAHFYRHDADQGMPRSDGFTWQSHSGEVDGFNQPSATSANSTLAHRNYFDQEHRHWYGIPDWYFATGDDTLKDSLLDGFVDYHTSSNVGLYAMGLAGGRSGTVNTSGTTVTSATGNTFVTDMVGSAIKIGSAIHYISTYNSSTSLTVTPSAGTQTGAQYYQGGGLTNSRSIGGHLAGAARMTVFLDSIGETSAATAVRTQADHLYNMMIKANVCMNAQPSNCAIVTVDPNNSQASGINRKRGAHYGAAGTTGTWCGVSHTYRVNSTFQQSIFIGGLLEYAFARGTGWSEYWTARDLAYGVSQFALADLFVDAVAHADGGFRFGLIFDDTNPCGEGGETPVNDDEYDVISFGQQTIWNIFWAQWLRDGGTSTWESKFKLAAAKLLFTGVNWSDYGSFQIANLIYRVLNPGNSAQSLTITDFTDLGGGDYELDVTVPTDCSSYRVKYAALTIVDWIGFDPETNAFTGNPTTTDNWFAATNATAPACGTPGTTQTISVDTGTAGMTVDKFSIMAVSGEVGVGDTSQRSSGVSRLGGAIRVQ